MQDAPTTIHAATSRYEASIVATPTYTNLRQTPLMAGPMFVTTPLAGLKELMRLPNRIVKPGSVAPAACMVSYLQQQSRGDVWRKRIRAVLLPRCLHERVQDAASAAVSGGTY